MASSSSLASPGRVRNTGINRNGGNSFFTISRYRNNCRLLSPPYTLFSMSRRRRLWRSMTNTSIWRHSRRTSISRNSINSISAADIPSISPSPSRRIFDRSLRKTISSKPWDSAGSNNHARTLLCRISAFSIFRTRKRLKVANLAESSSNSGLSARKRSSAALLVFNEFSILLLSSNDWLHQFITCHPRPKSGHGYLRAGAGPAPTLGDIHFHFPSTLKLFIRIIHYFFKRKSVSFRSGSSAWRWALIFLIRRASSWRARSRETPKRSPTCWRVRGFSARRRLSKMKASFL